MNRRLQGDTTRSPRLAATLVHNTGWLAAQSIFTMGFGAIVTAFAARYFGPERLGQLNYAFAFVGLFISLATLGMEPLVVKHAVEAKWSEGAIVGTGSVLRVFSGVTLTLFACGIVHFLQTDPTTRLLVLIMSLAMSARAFEVVQFVLRGRLQVRQPVLLRVAAYSVSGIGRLTVILLNGNIIQYALLYLLDNVIYSAGLVLLFVRSRSSDTRSTFSPKYARQLLGQSSYLMVAGLLSMVYNRIDQVMLGAMLPGKTPVGLYSSSVVIAEMWYFVPMAIINSLQPAIVAKREKNEHAYTESLNVLFASIAAISIAFCLIIGLAAKLILRILYGPTFVSASTSLIILATSALFVMLAQCQQVWMINEGLQHSWLTFVAIGAVFNVGANYVWIPRYGIEGSAFATLLSYTIVVLLLPLFLPSTRVSVLWSVRSLNPIWSVKTVLTAVRNRQNRGHSPSEGNDNESVQP